MRTVSADTQEANLNTLIEAAQIEPVAILEKGTRRAILVSSSEYDRLSLDDRIRREAKLRLKRTMAAMQARAAASGLTEAELDRLLADES